MQKIITRIFCCFALIIVSIQPALALEIRPRGVIQDMVIGTTEYYPNGKIPILGDKYEGTFYFNISIDDTKGDLLSSRFKNLKSNIPSTADGGAQETDQRRIDRYTIEHAVEVYTNNPHEVERVFLTVESTGPHAKSGAPRAYVSEIRYVDVNNPEIVLKTIHLDK